MVSKKATGIRAQPPTWPEQWLQEIFEDYFWMKIDFDWWFIYEYYLLVKRIHDLHDKSWIKNDVLLVTFGDILYVSWEQLQDSSFLALLGGNAHREIFSEENLSWIFFLRYTWLVYCVMGIISEKCIFLSWNFISHDFVYFLCNVQSEGDLFGGSSWKLRELTHVIRFLAYVNWLLPPTDAVVIFIV